MTDPDIIQNARALAAEEGGILGFLLHGTDTIQQMFFVDLTRFKTADEHEQGDLIGIAIYTIDPDSDDMTVAQRVIVYENDLTQAAENPLEPNPTDPWATWEQQP